MRAIFKSLFALTLVVLLAACTTDYTPATPVSAVCPLCKQVAKKHNDIAKEINSRQSKALKAQNQKEAFKTQIATLRKSISDAQANPHLTPAQKESITKSNSELEAKFLGKSVELAGTIVDLESEIRDLQKQLDVAKTNFERCENEGCAKAEASGETNALVNIKCPTCNVHIQAMNRLIRERAKIRHRIHPLVREIAESTSRLARARSRAQAEARITPPNTALIARLERHQKNLEKKISAAEAKKKELEKQLAVKGAKLADALEKWRRCESTQCRAGH